MNPNAFLKTFWRSEIRPQIFVAMSFAESYKRRYDEVIMPAIESITLRRIRLKAYRVDISKTGDSILTDILDGIAHSEMFLADVSTIGYDSKTGDPYRNGNVMYEVGIALACRQASEILLIRDDHHRFLFDVSTIPHKFIDFAQPEKARKELAQELVGRLKEREYLDDARLQIAIASLTGEELDAIKAFAGNTLEQIFWANEQNLLTMAALPRLLDKQLLKTVATTDDGKVAFAWTTLGYEVARSVKTLLPIVKTEAPPATNLDTESTDKTNGSDSSTIGV